MTAVIASGMSAWIASKPAVLTWPRSSGSGGIALKSNLCCVATQAQGSGLYATRASVIDGSLGVGLGRYAQIWHAYQSPQRPWSRGHRLPTGAEGCVECGRRRLDLRQPADEGQGVRRPNQAIHAGVLPLHRERAFVADGVQEADAGFPWNVAVPGRDEVPAPAGGAPRQGGGKPTISPAELALGVPDMDVVDPVAEVP